MPSDGVRLAGEVLGEALLPGVRVLPDSGAAAGHQGLRAEAAAAARSARLPWPGPSLVQREPEGRRKGGAKEDAGNPAGREAALSFPFSILPCRTDLSGPACGSPRLFILWTCSLTALQGKGHALEPLAGDFSGWEEVFQKIEWEKESAVQLWTVSATSISCIYVLHF